jgi:phosphoglycolate phosphatase
MTYKLAIFDFDGTLADSFAWALRVINDVAGKYRFRRIQQNEIDALRNYDARKMIEHLGIPMWKLPLVTAHMRKRMTNDIEEIPLFVGVDMLLKRLADRGVTIAIVSSNALANVTRVLGPENVALVQYFACGAAFLGKRAKLRQIIRRSGFLSAEAILIGDEIRDLQAAREEKVAFGAVFWGFNSQESLKRHLPEFEFASMNEILESVTWGKREVD